MILINKTLASLKTIFVDKPENILVLLKIVKQVPTLKRIVLTKKLPNDKDLEIRTKAKEVNIEVLSYNQLRVCQKRITLFFVFYKLILFKEIGQSKPVPHHVRKLLKLKF